MGESHNSQKSAKSYINQLENQLDIYLVKKAPALPKGGKEFIVNFAPWLVIIGAVFSVPAIISLIGLTGAINSTPYASMMAASLGPTYYLSIILLAVVILLELFALPGLFARKKSGWNLIFYASLASALSSLISLNILSFIIGTLISLYLLFQVKEYYK